MDNLDPVVEFDEPVTPAEPKIEAPPGATAAEVAVLRAELAEAKASNASLATKTQVLDRLSAALNPNQGPVLSERDRAVREEILRLAPEIRGTNADLTKIKGMLPAVLETVGATADERVIERTATAQDRMQELIKSVGLDADDADVCGYMEEALVRQIGKDPALKAMWDRGQVRNAVNKAFEKVSSKIIAPIRAGAKRSAVTTINETPRATPRGGATSAAAGAAPAVDFKDTSRDGLKKLADAAFDRLQELTESN